MRVPILQLAVAFGVLITIHASAVIHYVDLNSTNAMPPFTDWSTAATNIQDAVDVATNGDQILVTNGVYETGSRRAVGFFLFNRLVVSNAVVVQSVNGPDFTTIKGFQVPGTTNGIGAVRCVYLGKNASLVGFTITNGATFGGSNPTEEKSGGGIYCPSTTAVISNCVIIGNASFAEGGGIAHGAVINSRLQANTSATGGGAYFSSLKNCYLISNTAPISGGAAHLGSLINCSVMGNSAANGGGVYQCNVTNCTLIANFAANTGGGANSSFLKNSILYNNTASNSPNYFAGQSGTLDYCCTLPMPSSGIGNITNDPQLASFSHISQDSPCIAAGNSAYATGVDIDGEIWSDPPSIGCDEYRLGQATGSLDVAIQISATNATTLLEISFTAQISGRVSGSYWDFGDGIVKSNTLSPTHVWMATGDYLVQLTAFNDSHPNGVTAALNVHVTMPAIHYVSLDSTNPQSPYNSWLTAATNIQDAIDAAPPGDIVLISNGVYNVGGRKLGGLLTNRVAVTRPLRLQSVNGPSATVIQGYQLPSTINGTRAIRCVYLTNGATLAGFTLTNGATSTSGFARDGGGGGVFMESNAIVSNCVIAGNAAYNYGGGAFGGTLINCTLFGNSAIYGGGASSNALFNCALTANSAAQGGAAYGAFLNNCTVMGNYADSVGGSIGCTLNNCVDFYNSSIDTQSNYSSSVFNYSCTVPLPTNGTGNITNEPLFLTDSYRLETNSPCINSGDNSFVGLSVDLDGNPRITGGTVDIGAYEFQSPSSTLSYAWAQQFGLSIDSTADFADLDGDGLNNWQEWIAGTNPTNGASVLAMEISSTNSSGINLGWQSIAGKTYFLQRATNLFEPPTFISIKSNLVGATDITTYSDTTATNGGPYFYRVGLQ